MKHRLYIIAYLWLLTGILSSAFGSQAPAATSKSVFEHVKHSVVQIRTLLKGSQSQSSIGSGFYVTTDGLIISNYHVVSSQALQPDTYTLEYVDSQGAHGTLRLLAIDVLHDLALLQRDGKQLPSLRLQTTSPAQGENLYSLGNPNDLGLSIVAGVNNGLREHSFYDALHFTGALNPGMSGGPVVNQAHEVVGINEASMGQSRGFLVPAKFAAELLQHWQKHPVVPPKFRPEIARQMKLHSATLTQRLTSKPFPVQMDAGYAIPDAPDPYIRCWAHEFNEPKMFYHIRTYRCSGRAEVFIEDDITLGHVNFSTQLYQTSKLDFWRFGRVLERNYGTLGDGNFEGPDDYVSNYACQDSTLQLHGLRAKVALCTRAYRKLPGLYDIYMKLVTLEHTQDALVSKLDLIGVTYEDGMRIVQSYLGAFKWKK